MNNSQGDSTTAKEGPRTSRLATLLQDASLRAGLLLTAALLYSIAIVHMTTVVRLLYVPIKALVLVGAEAAAAGLLVSASLFASRQWQAGNRWSAVRDLVIGASTGAGLAILLGGGITLQSMESSRNLFAKEREQYAKAPDGFRAFRKFARDQFGVELELGGLEESWLVTTHSGPGSSVAAMSVGSGYCLLSMSPHGVERRFEAPASIPNGPAVMLQFIMAHELGHCVDISRDSGSFQQPTAVGSRSVAPHDAHGVSDVHTFYEAGLKPSTVLWREVYADLFAIGYAHLTWPSHSRVLSDAWLQARRAGAVADPTHATACWLEAARAEPAPEAIGNIAAWVDRIRSTAQCPVGSQRHPPGRAD